MTNALMQDFGGKIVQVTGAGSGIGRAAAELFAARGASVAVVNRTASKGQETVERIRAAGGRAEFIHADLSEPAAVTAMMEETLALFGTVDCAFNNAGVTGTPGEFHRIAAEDWHAVLAVNLSAVFFCMQQQIAHMLEHGGGVIVNNGSGASVIDAPGLPHYTAAKHGLLGLMKVAGKEYASRNIRINTILPGVIETEPMKAYLESSADGGAGFLASLPGGKIGVPVDVAEAAVWLCSAEARYVSGATLVVDGGYMCP